MQQFLFVPELSCHYFWRCSLVKNPNRLLVSCWHCSPKCWPSAPRSLLDVSLGVLFIIAQWIILKTRKQEKKTKNVFLLSGIFVTASCLLYPLPVSPVQEGHWWVECGSSPVPLGWWGAWHRSTRGQAEQAAFGHEGSETGFTEKLWVPYAWKCWSQAGWRFEQLPIV